MKKQRTKVLYRGRLPLFTLLIASISGCASTAIKGEPPAGIESTLVRVRAAQPGARVTVRGTLLDKCPIAGCWFHLRDSGTTLRVDTKAAGFTVTDVPLQTEVVVSGKITREGRESVLGATGLSY